MIISIDLILAILYDEFGEEDHPRVADITPHSFFSFLSNEKTVDVAASQQFNPFAGKHFMPNFASLWCDPNWSGMSTNSIAIKNLGGTESSRGTPQSSFFRFQGTLSYIEPSSLQKAFVDHFQVSCGYGGFTVCNSFKCHFFLRETSTMEDKRQFLYSSSFPMFSEGEEDSSSVEIYGLFNYNFNEDKCAPIPRVRLAVHKIRPVYVNTADVRLLALRGPTQNSHDNVMDISNWFQIIIQALSPQSKSSFINTRTLCRDYGNSPLFQHLPFLFQNPTGTTLPPEILFYVCYHSIWLNRIPWRDVLENLQIERILSQAGGDVSIEDESTIPNILLFIRDTLAPWTLCVYEGLYWSDCSLNQNVEDQPFPMSFLGGNRIFKKDDCEGRVSEAQQIALLFKSFYITLVQGKENNPRTSIERWARAYAFEVSPARSRLQLSPDTWHSLIAACFALGYYFFHGLIELHTTVGDVNFASFTSSENIEDESSKHASPTGHSFGVIIYNDKRKGKRHAAILEATGWERTILSPLKHSELQLIGNISKWKNSQKKSNLNICGHLSHKHENAIYQNICLGNDCLFFTKLESTGSQLLNYGAKLSLFKEGKVKLFHEKSQEGEDAPAALQISTSEFIRQMINVERYINKKSTQVPFFIREHWIDISSKQRIKSWQRILRGVEDIASKYEKYLASLPMHRRCLCTPQRKENEYLSLMEQHWGIITERQQQEEQDKENGILMSILSSHGSDYAAEQEQLIQFLNEQPREDAFQIVSSTPFMHSTIVKVKSSCRSL